MYNNIYICSLYTGEDGKQYAAHEAMLDMSNIAGEKVNGKTFPQIFDKPLSGGLWVDGLKELVTEDDCGAPLCYAEIPEVLNWLFDSEVGENYWRGHWRVIMAEQMLTTFARQSKEYFVVYYGY